MRPTASVINVMPRSRPDDFQKNLQTDGVAKYDSYRSFGAACWL